MTCLSPTSELELASIILDAHAHKTPLSIEGGGTRVGLGRPVQTASTLSMRRLTGITLYEPSEMVIGAKAGTALSEIEATLNEKGQMLAFEPMDHRTLFGTTGEPSIGAIAAINACGPRRIMTGAARDSLVGVRFVNGMGEIVKNGGRVMKNVTGLDLVKLQAGAFGTLGVISEVIFKVLPCPETSASLSFNGLSDTQAVSLMSKAQGSPYEVTGAAHLPDQTLIRIEGFEDSVNYRLGELQRLLEEFGTGDVLRETHMWRDIRDCALFSHPQEAVIWRICVKPMDAPKLITELSKVLSFKHYFDWGGGLIWLSCDAPDGGAKLIRAEVNKHQGHARIERASVQLRATINVFQPLSAPIMQITAGIKKSFDAGGILNSGRMYGGV